MKTKIIILFLLLSAFGCRTKKQTSQSEIKSKVDVELSDNSTINRSENSEKQHVKYSSKERIITMYGVRMVPVPSGKDTIYIPISYPVKKEENRDIVNEIFLWKMSVRDSIQNAIELKYSSKFQQQEEKLIELKESTLIYQIACLVAVVLALLLFLLYVFKR